MIFYFEEVTIPKIEKVTKDDGSRYYVVNEKKYPSVTTILKEHNKDILNNWISKVGKETAKEISNLAARRGSRTHKIIETYLRNNELKLSDPVTSELFQRLKKSLDRISRIRLLETPLYSHHLRLAGTVDCIANFDGTLSVIDFKTSIRQKEKSMIEHYFMQCAAYAIMFEEITKIPIGKIVIIIANDDEETQVFTEKRDNFVKPLLFYRDKYEEGLTS
jgi:ATP-dependent exoDNAse (exonuclease V) beta subunit